MYFNNSARQPGAPPPQQTYAISIWICSGLKTNKWENSVDTDTIQFQPKPGPSVWNEYRWGSGFHSGVDLYGAAVPLLCTVAATAACCVQERYGKYTNPFAGNGESPCAFDSHTHRHTQDFAILKWVFHCATTHHNCLVWKLTVSFWVSLAQRYC